MNTTPYESEEQEAFVQYLEAKGIRFFAVPNGGHRHKSTAIQLKNEGVRAGVPDLVILAKNKRHSVLFLEMKRQTGGDIRKHQQEWIEWLDDNDYAVAVAKGCDEAIKWLNVYLNNEY